MNALGKWYTNRNWPIRTQQRLLVKLDKSPGAFRAMFADNYRIQNNGDTLYDAMCESLKLDSVDAAILRVAIDRSVVKYTLSTLDWPDARLRPAAYHLIRKMPQLTDEDWEAVMLTVRERLRGES